MTAQVFRGKTVDEARQAAIATLGSEAVLLTTRSVPTPGLKGALGSREVEISAVAPDRPSIPSVPSPSVPMPFAAGLYEVSKTEPVATATAADVATLRIELRALRLAMARGQSQPSALLDEIASLRAAVEDLSPPENAKRTERIAAVLRNLCIDGQAAAYITEALHKPRNPGETRTDVLANAITEQIRVQRLPILTEGRKVVGLVGPSGVGKTTTAAKLAAYAKHELGQRVLLVNTDTFRVGAVQQIERYAELLDLPLEIVSTAKELRSVLKRAKADLVIVDTSGQTQLREDSAEAFLARPSWENSSLARHVVLCVPAALRSLDAARIGQMFAPLTPTAIAVTKLDETDAPAGLLHASVETGLPVCALCTGPNVPDDLVQATGGTILESVLKRHRSSTRGGNA
jgi:flagellar biosynthesis protein FlhF